MNDIRSETPHPGNLPAGTTPAPTASALREWLTLLAAVVAAALLTGLLALPFTLRGGVLASAPSVGGVTVSVTLLTG